MRSSSMFKRGPVMALPGPRGRRSSKPVLTKKALLEEQIALVEIYLNQGWKAFGTLSESSRQHLDGLVKKHGWGFAAQPQL